MALAVRATGAVSATTGNGAVAPTMPTHVSGDLLVAVYVIRPIPAGVWTTPTGWTAAPNLGTHSFNVFYKFAASSSETSPSSTCSGTSAQDTKFGFVFSVSGGVDTTTPIFSQSTKNDSVNVSGQMVDSSGTNYITGAGDMVVLMFCADNDWTSASTVVHNGFTAPTITFTEIVDTFSTLGSDAALCVDYAVTAAAHSFTNAQDSFTVTITAATQPVNYTFGSLVIKAAAAPASQAYDTPLRPFLHNLLR
jgi:hypothetical protein